MSKVDIAGVRGFLFSRIGILSIEADFCNKNDLDNRLLVLGSEDEGTGGFMGSFD